MCHENPIENTIYRADALRIFISVLKRPLCDILFSSLTGFTYCLNVGKSTSLASGSEDQNRTKSNNFNISEQKMKYP